MIGSAALLEVVVIPDLFLTNVIDYDASSQTVSFSGSDSDSELQTGYFKLKITLFDVNGLKSTYTQVVIVSEQKSPRPESELDTKKQEPTENDQSDAEDAKTQVGTTEQATTKVPSIKYKPPTRKPELSFEAI